jgi:intracellular sulfur oxidation DsrE/DsrF family protein
MEDVMENAIDTALAFVLAMALVAPATAQTPSLEAFDTGPVFEEFGPHAPVDGASTIPSLSRFDIAFDVADVAKEGARNRSFESAARFINMHAAAGVSLDRMNLAVVVHGRAVTDLVSGQANRSEPMVRAMLERGVRFIVCGQSAAAYGVRAEQLIEGVEMQISAMTAHALLQQDGYTVNPF